MQTRIRPILVILTTLIFAAGMTAACGDDEGSEGNSGNGNNGGNGSAVGAGYTGCDGLPELDDMAEGPELDEAYLIDGIYEIVDIETAARIQNIEVIPGTLRISNAFVDSDNRLECLNLPNLEVVEGSIRGRDFAVNWEAEGYVSENSMPEEITFENLTTVGEDFTFAHVNDQLQRVKAPVLTTTNTESDPSDSSVQGVYIMENDGLVELSMPSLQSAYHFAVMDNPVLETLDVSSLNEVTSWVQIKENPNFSSCEAQQIADDSGRPAATIEVCGNHDDGCDESC